jgi:hypothetical protein
MGMRRPVTVLQHGTTVSDIVNLAAITAVAANLYSNGDHPMPPVTISEPVLETTK